MSLLDHVKSVHGLWTASMEPVEQLEARHRSDHTTGNYPVREWQHDIDDLFTDIEED